MNKHRQNAQKIELKNMKRNRRKKLEDLELEEYREIVMQMNQKTEEIDNNIMLEVCDKLNIDSQMYQESVRKVDQTKLHQQMREDMLFDIKNAIKSRFSDEITDAKEMSREFTYKVFQYEQELRIGCFKALERTKDDQMQEEFLVQDSIMIDKMYARFKVEKETYNQAILMHDFSSDPKIQVAVAKTDATVSPWLRERLVKLLKNNDEEAESDLEEVENNQEEEEGSGSYYDESVEQEEGEGGAVVTEVTSDLE